MQKISPRLSRLLSSLLERTEPVSVQELGRELDASRRTIFRELENIDRTLSPFNLTLDSSSGRGIKLSGGTEERTALSRALGETDAAKPGSQKERLLRLTLELLANSGAVQKILYYSSLLDVSEATVSNDITMLESFFNKYNIMIIRKPGQGVYAVGNEHNIRQAMIMRIARDGVSIHSIYSMSDIAGSVAKIRENLKDELDWMTEESIEMLDIFLTVSICRLQKGAVLPEYNDSAIYDKTIRNSTLYNRITSMTIGDFQKQLAKLITHGIEKQCALHIPSPEQDAIALYIQGCRAKQRTPLCLPDEKDNHHIEALVFRMIDAFDPRIAPTLKINERLLLGLASHLLPAITRIKKKIELPDPFQGQLASDYPDLYMKTRQAVRLLEQSEQCAVPESEVSFFATHFYAALFAMDEQKTRKRTLSAGLICVGGIGVSYMAASQIRKRFKGDLEIKVSDWNDSDAWTTTDFLISTVPLATTGKTVVRISALLTDDDYRAIQDAINAYAFVEKTAALGTEQTRHSLIERLDAVSALLEDARILINSFAVRSIDADCSFEALARYASDSCGNNDKTGQNIFSDLINREKVATQIIKDMGIVLLHARTKGVSKPAFMLIRPHGGTFTDTYFYNAQICVLMLVPDGCPQSTTMLMGTISSALIDSPEFLEAIKKGDGRRTRTLLEAELSEFLALRCKEKLAG
jgi:mannitol operon transcriptional antiterminator